MTLGSIFLLHEIAQKIGQGLDTWLKESPDHRLRFAEQAELTLHKWRDAILEYTVEDFESYVLHSKKMESQLYSGPDFSECPVTLYFSPSKQFCVDIYYWVSTDTIIHDHKFGGAFMAFSGKSLQTTFSFENSSNILDETGTLQHGELKHKVCQSLIPGDIIRIRPGEAFIHRVNHLTLPMLTFLIRSCDVAACDPKNQFSYFGPLRTAKFDQAIVAKKQRQLLAALIKIDSKHPQIPKLFTTIDPPNIVPFFNQAVFAVKTEEDLRGVLIHLEKKYPEFMSHLHRAFEWMREDVQRVDQEKLTSFENKTLGNLLVNADDYPEMETAIRRLVPDANIEEWLVNNLKSLVAQSAIKIKVPEILIDMLRPSLRNLPSNSFLNQLKKLGWKEIVEKQSAELIELRKKSSDLYIFRSLAKY